MILTNQYGTAKVEASLDGGINEVVTASGALISKALL